MERALVVGFVLIAVTGLVVAGMLAPSSPEATSSPSTSPESPTMPVEPSNEPSVFPPGASEAGIDNATRLVTAHRAALANTSYAERSEWEEAGRVSTPNGTSRGFEVRQYTVTAESGGSGTEVHIGSENDSNTYWFTENATVTNTSSQEYGSTSTFYEYSQGDTYRSNINRHLVTFSSRLVQPYLRDLDYELVETTTRDGRTLHTYSSTGINETVKPNRGDTPLSSTTEDITATVVVSERGIVHSFTARETHAHRNEPVTSRQSEPATPPQNEAMSPQQGETMTPQQSEPATPQQNDTVTIEQNYAVEGIGETNAVAPAWVTEEIAQFDASLVSDGSVVALEHVGGVSVSDPPLWFNTPNGSNQTTVDGTIEPGDTVYVYLVGQGDSNGILRTSTNEQPPANDSFVSLRGGNLSVTVWRHVLESHDSGVQLDVTIRERPVSSTERNATAGTSPVAGE